MRKPLSLRHPLLYWLRIQQRRLFRHFKWIFCSYRFSKDLSPNQKLQYRYTKHTSKLIRQLGGTDLALQINKVENLKIASQCINGIIIKPGEYFSFCRLVGKPTKKRGFLVGMELSFGEARSGVGGGICQLSNLIHWMSLHSPLVVVERSNHSFDPFPDQGRILPFGSGAAIFYNFVDLMLFNPTQQSFQILVRVGKHQLEGEILSNNASSVKYHIHQKNHKFYKINDRVFRQNEIWRDIITKGNNPEIISSSLLYKNNAVVKYKIEEQSMCFAPPPNPSFT